VQREALEARLQQMEEQLRRPVHVVRPREEPGCLASLFGLFG
jgi:hypothetical protein